MENNLDSSAKLKFIWTRTIWANSMMRRTITDRRSPRKSNRFFYNLFRLKKFSKIRNGCWQRNQELLLIGKLQNAKWTNLSEQLTGRQQMFPLYKVQVLQTTWKSNRNRETNIHRSIPIQWHGIVNICRSGWWMLVREDWLENCLTRFPSNSKDKWLSCLHRKWMDRAL